MLTEGSWLKINFVLQINSEFKKIEWSVVLQGNNSTWCPDSLPLFSCKIKISPGCLTMMWEGLFLEISSQEAGRYWPIDSFPCRWPKRMSLWFMPENELGWSFKCGGGGQTFRIDSRDRTSRGDLLPARAFAVIIEFARTCT